MDSTQAGSQVAGRAAALRAEGLGRNHRLPLVLAGEHRWCLRAAQEALQGAGIEGALWITRSAPPKVRSMPAAAAHQVLGQEIDAAVFDAHSGFDLDAFGAIAGARSGEAVCCSCSRHRSRLGLTSPTPKTAS
jgi:tRNA(Met) cytidine acetyltransferase